MTTHHLKIWPEFYSGVALSKKTFEVRRNDRDFKIGDTLVLAEWDPNVYNHPGGEPAYTGREVKVKVTYICDIRNIMSEDIVGMSIVVVK